MLICVEGATPNAPSIHPLSFAHSGHGKEAQTSLSTATWASCSQADPSLKYL